VHAATVPTFFFVLCFFKIKKKVLINIVRDLFIPLVGRVFSFSNRFWDGLFFFNLLHVRVGLEIIGFGTGCNFFAKTLWKISLGHGPWARA
jgi:hypothetical protein